MSSYADFDMEAFQANYNSQTSIQGILVKDVIEAIGQTYINTTTREENEKINDDLRSKVANYLAPKEYSSAEIKQACKDSGIPITGSKKVLALRLAFKDVHGFCPDPLGRGRYEDDAKTKKDEAKTKKNTAKSTPKSDGKKAKKNNTKSEGTKPPSKTPKDDDNNDWEYIDQADTLKITFSEIDHCISPYEMEIAWKNPHDPDHEIFWQGYSSGRGKKSREDFVDLIQKAAKRATSVKTLIVGYANELDRTWPYTRVRRVAEVFSKIRGVEASLTSVDTDYMEYTVEFVPMNSGAQQGGKKKRKRGGEDAFTSSLDLSKIDIFRKFYVIDYIGNAEHLM